MLRTFAQAAGGGVGKTAALVTISRFGGEAGSYDITDASDMDVLDETTSVGSRGRCVYDAAAQVLFSLNNDNGLFAVDCSDVSNLTQVDSITFGTGSTWYISLDEINSILYVTATAGILYSIDVSDPTNMTILDTLTDLTNLDGARGIAFNPARTRAYVVARDITAVVTIDISDPSSLSILGAFTSSGLSSASEIVIDQNTETGYVAANAVYALDCSGVVATALSTVGTGGSPSDICLSEVQGVVYLPLTTEDSVVAIDVSNPSSLSVISTLTDSLNLNYAYRLDVDEARQLLFVTAQLPRHLVSVDVSDPSSMTVLDTIRTSDEAPFDVALA